MNWETIEGKWDQFAGKIREKWAKLTDDDIESIAGKKDRLMGKLQERYGYRKDELDRDFNRWMDTLH